MDYQLPEGFRFIDTRNHAVRFEHLESGKQWGVDWGLALEPAPTEQVQREIDYQCHRILREVGLDKLWTECRGDRAKFDEMRALQTAEKSNALR